MKKNVHLPQMWSKCMLNKIYEISKVIWPLVMVNNIKFSCSTIFSEQSLCKFTYFISKFMVMSLFRHDNVTYIFVNEYLILSYNEKYIIQSIIHKNTVRYGPITTHITDKSSRMVSIMIVFSMNIGHFVY